MPIADTDTFLRTEPYSRKQLFIVAVVLVIVGVLAYQPLWKAGFIWDDDQYVTHNPLLRDAAGLWDIWFSRKTPQYYPAVFTSFWFEYQLYGLQPLGYHLVNLALHLGNALLLAFLLRRLGLPFPWWIAFLFAVHPVAVESVAWVTERKNVLSLFFALFAFRSYLDFDDTGSRRAYLTSLSLFIIALLSKSVTCILPVMFLLVVFYRRGIPTSREVKSTVPFFAFGLLLGLHTALFEQTAVGQSGSLYLLTWYERVLLTTKMLLFYLGKLLFPYPLVFSYPKWQLAGAAPIQYFSIVVLVLLVAVLLLQLQQGRKGPFVLFACYAAALFPALGFFDVYPFRFSYVADHFQYHAAPVGLALLVVAAERVLGGIWQRMPLLAHGMRGSVVLLLAMLTWKQAQVYQDIDTLYRDTLLKNPCSTLAHNNLGSRQAAAGNHSEAMWHFNTLLECDPSYVEGYRNRAALQLRLDEYQAAAADYTRALELTPAWADLYYGRAYTYSRMGKLASAFRDINKALALVPTAASFYQLRGGIRWQGRRDATGACADWQRACELGSCTALRELPGKEICEIEPSL